MASGFIILSDGRCHAPNWAVYDDVLKAIINELNDSLNERELKEKLLNLIPNENDIADVGYGAWIRKSDGKIVERYLDIRSMKIEYRKIFQNTIKKAANDEHIKNSYSKIVVASLEKLSEMVRRIEKGEEPLSLSDWTEIIPPGK